MPNSASIVPALSPKVYLPTLGYADPGIQTARRKYCLWDLRPKVGVGGIYVYTYIVRYRYVDTQPHITQYDTPLFEKGKGVGSLVTKGKFQAHARMTP